MAHAGHPPGITYWFRVRAPRNDETSIPLNVAVIWETEQVVPLELAA